MIESHMKVVRFLITTTAISLSMLSFVHAGPVFTPSTAKAHASLNLFQRVMVETGNREGSLQRIFHGLGERFRYEGVLEESHVVELDALDLAQDRAQRVAQYLAYDINGDGIVTRSEVATKLSHTPSRLTVKGATRISDELFALDKNADDQIDVQEMLKLVPAFAERRRSSDIAFVLSLDPNGDGRVTKKELINLFLSAWDNIDINGDGMISNSERAALAPR